MTIVPKTMLYSTKNLLYNLYKNSIDKEKILYYYNDIKIMLD